MVKLVDTPALGAGAERRVGSSPTQGTILKNMKVENIKVEKLIDVANNPDHPIMKEVQNNNNGEEGDKVECADCGKEYKRGVWNFYNLCDDCYKEFDRKKTERMWQEIARLNQQDEERRNKKQ